MFFIYVSLGIIYLAMMLLIWQIGKLSKENKVLMQEIEITTQKTQSQEQNLKQTLGIMQELAKKMHVQQEVLDNTSHRLTEVEFQNAELIKILQRNIQP